MLPDWRSDRRVGVRQVPKQLQESLLAFVVGGTELFVLLNYECTVRYLVCGTLRNIDALPTISPSLSSQRYGSLKFPTYDH